MARIAWCSIFTIESYVPSNPAVEEETRCEAGAMFPEGQR
jgi:hypothetical protein